MGTRGVIAEMHEPGVWRGRYHHLDSYPTALGKTLFELYNGHFNKDLKAMLKVLLHDHPAGWSTINANWKKPIGYEEPGQYTSNNRGPACYCHGSRAEEGDEWIGPRDDAGAEWAYVFSNGVAKPTMAILRHRWSSDGKPYVGIGGMSAKEPLKWDLIRVIKLDQKRMPAWKAIEKKGYS